MTLHPHVRRTTSPSDVAETRTVRRSGLGGRLGNQGMLQLMRAVRDMETVTRRQGMNALQVKENEPPESPAAQRTAVVGPVTAPSSETLARREQPVLASGASAERETCAPSAGVPPSRCGAYLANAWWLPLAYVNNATCACRETPNVPTANCVRKFLQDRVAATPTWVKRLAAIQKPYDNPISPMYPTYQAFVQAFLTPRIYSDHVDAYAHCCCPSGPAPYPAWIGVTTVPLPCPAVGWSIRQFGSCHGTPGSW